MDKAKGYGDKFYHCHMLFCIYDRTCIWPGCTCFGSIQRNKNFGIKEGFDEGRTVKRYSEYLY